MCGFLRLTRSPTARRRVQRGRRQTASPYDLIAHRSWPTAIPGGVAELAAATRSIPSMPTGCFRSSSRVCSRSPSFGARGCLQWTRGVSARDGRHLGNGVILLSSFYGWQAQLLLTTASTLFVLMLPDRFDPRSRPAECLGPSLFAASAIAVYGWSCPVCRRCRCCLLELLAAMAGGEFGFGPMVRTQAVDGRRSHCRNRISRDHTGVDHARSRFAAPHAVLAELLEPVRLGLPVRRARPRAALTTRNPRHRLGNACRSRGGCPDRPRAPIRSILAERDGPRHSERDAYRRTRRARRNGVESLSVVQAHGLLGSAVHAARPERTFVDTREFEPTLTTRMSVIGLATVNVLAVCFLASTSLAVLTGFRTRPATLMFPTARAAEALPPRTVIQVNVEDGWEQAWLAYYLRDRPIALQSPSLVFVGYSKNDAAHAEKFDVPADVVIREKSPGPAIWTDGRFAIYAIKNHTGK